jgi:hypothetical protein
MIFVSKNLFSLFAHFNVFGSANLIYFAFEAFDVNAIWKMGNFTQSKKNFDSEKVFNVLLWRISATNYLHKCI